MSRPRTPREVHDTVQARRLAMMQAAGKAGVLAAWGRESEGVPDWWPALAPLNKTERQQVRALVAQALAAKVTPVRVPPRPQARPATGRPGAFQPPSDPQAHGPRVPQEPPHGASSVDSPPRGG